MADENTVLVDGRDVTDVVDDVAASLEFDRDVADITDRILICIDAPDEWAIPMLRAG